MQLTIEQVKAGDKSTGLKVGDKWYRIRNADGASRLSAGMTIDATVVDSEWEGKTIHWVKSFSVADSAPAAAPTLKGNDRWWAPFVSNVVAHAIQGGQIDSHDKIRLWSSAAYSAIQALDRGDETPFSRAELGRVNNQLSEEAKQWLKDFDPKIDPMKAILEIENDLP